MAEKFILTSEKVIQLSETITQLGSSIDVETNLTKKAELQRKLKVLEHERKWYRAQEVIEVEEWDISLEFNDHLDPLLERLVQYHDAIHNASRKQILTEKRNLSDWLQESGYSRSDLRQAKNILLYSK